MKLHTQSPDLDNALVNPANWADDAGIHEQFTWLRNNDPMRFMQPEGFDPFWNLTKHEDIKQVEGKKRIFINDPRAVLAPKGRDELVTAITGHKHLVRSLVQMDDPDHSKYRAFTQGWFMGSNLARLQSRIDDLARMYVDRMADLGGECDFVKEVAVWYPLRVIMEILGVPEEDEALMLKLTRELFGPTDPDNERSFNQENFFDVVREFEDYFRALTKKRRENPTDDVASLIANADFDGEAMPDHETNGYYIIIATAGHDTTSSSTSGGVHALIEHPGEAEKLRQNPDEGLMLNAVDEVIRWVTPVRHFMRTATEDYELRGNTIKAGESVMMWYPSANRDEEAFDNPFEFRVDRKAKHLAFGFGAHVCLGQHLARMEIAALYRELLSRVTDMELTGEPRYTESTFVGGLKSLPIRYRMK